MELRVAPEPDFERLRTTLLCGQADRIPMCELGIDTGIKGRLLGREIRTIEDDMDFYYRAGYDYYFIRIKGRVPPDSRTDPRFVRAFGESSWHISFGEKVWIRDEESFHQYPWETEEDFERELAKLDEADRHLRPGVGIIVNIGPLFNALGRIMGFQEFNYALFDDPELVRKITDQIGESLYYIASRAMEHDSVRAIWLGDDIAYAEALMVSPAVMREFFFPWEKKIGALCRERGRLFLRHTDGRLDSVLDDFLDCGYCALNPLEEKSMDICAVKRKYAGRLCVIGNVDVGEVLATGTPDDVRRDVMKKMRLLGPGGGYCLSSGNTIPDYVPYDNYVTMLNTWQAYCRYPLQIPEEVF